MRLIVNLPTQSYDSQGFGVVHSVNRPISCRIFFLLNIRWSERLLPTVSDLINCRVFRGVLEQVFCDTEWSESWRSFSGVRHCSVGTASCCRRHWRYPAFQVRQCYQWCGACGVDWTWGMPRGRLLLVMWCLRSWLDLRHASRQIIISDVGKVQRRRLKM